MRKLIILGLLLCSQQGLAFRFSPMSAELSPEGNEATQTFVVDNTGGEKIALQAEVFHRIVDDQGQETRTASDEFTLFPEQMILEPGERRNIRLTWSGDRHPKTELCYRLVVSQLSVDMKKPEKRKPGARIDFLLQYVASVYVIPGESRAKIAIQSYKNLESGKAELILINTGSAHRVLKGIHVSLKNKDQSFEITDKQIKDLQAENILPGNSRRFIFELPAKLVPAKAELRFDSN